MNVKEAKLKLAEITGSTNIKHPKVLVAELCSVIKYLLDEIEDIKKPTMTLSQTIPSGPNPSLCNPVKLPSVSIPLRRNRSAPISDPLEKHRRGNAGDAI